MNTKIQNLEQEFTTKNLQDCWQYVKSKLKSAISIQCEKTEENELKLGVSKIGGSPDLPQNIDWLKDKAGKTMSLIAQINLAEITDYDIEHKLPKQGILYFFYDAETQPWGFDPQDKGRFKVLFLKDQDLDLERKQIPADLDQKMAYFKTAKLSFETILNLPDLSSSVMDYTFENQQEEEHYFNWIDDNEQGLINKLLGHSNNMQDGMELECALMSNGIYCEDSKGYSQENIKKFSNEAEKWTLLLQIDSNENLGMMWGDAGRLYFWIKEEDLKNENFDQVWCVLQCG